MKSFIAGLLTMLVLGVVGFFTFKSTLNLMQRLNPSPSPSPSSKPCASECSELLSSSPQPQADLPRQDTPSPTYEPAIKGVSTSKTVTTTTTTSHLTLTLVKTSTCPISYMTEVKDIEGPLTLEYSLKDGYSFGITIWKNDGNELLSNTTYSGSSGQIKTISGVDYMKVRIESKTCASNNENWLTLTAER